MRRAIVIALAILFAAPSARALDILTTNPLYDPVIAGDLAKAERVLATGGSPVEIAFDSTGKTPLMLAAAAGNDDMVSLLL